MVAAAAKAPPLRTSMVPAGLNRTSVAKPVYAVCAPLENAITLSVGDADGVASNVAVNAAAWLVNARFCQPLVGEPVTQAAATTSVTEVVCCSAPAVPVTVSAK